MLGGAPAKVQAAALPWRGRQDRFELLLVTSRETGRWIVPKGWPDGDESLHQAAKREAWEEAGIEGAISDICVGSFFYDKVTGPDEVVRCQVFLFPLEVTQLAKKWPEKGQRQREWITTEEAAKLVNEPALAEMIGAFVPNQRNSAA